MGIKRIGKFVIEKIVNQFGYSLAYNGPLAKEEWAETPVVYNAFLGGKCFRCIRNTTVAEYVLTGKGWDNNIPPILSECLNRNPDGIVLEVGANVGASIMPICNQFPSREFHMIEPVPRFFNLLAENKGSLDAVNAFLYNVAVSDRDGGVLDIHYDLGNGGACIIEGGVVQTVSVPVRTLDSMFKGRAIAFMKIDVDGYELNVLKGASQLIAESKPDVLFEFHQGIMERLSIDPDELLGVLVGCGLDRFDVYTNNGKIIEKLVDRYQVLKLSEEIQRSGAVNPYLDVLAKAR